MSFVLYPTLAYERIRILPPTLQALYSLETMERTLVPRLTANHVPSSPRAPKSFDVLTAQYFAAHAYLSSCPSTTLEPFRHTHLVSPPFLLHLRVACPRGAVFLLRTRP